MTASRVAVITGCEITVGADPAKPHYFVASAYDGPTLVAQGRACCRPAAALSDLVEKVYRIRCEEVRRRAKWRCEKCQAIKPIQVHHIKLRSHGRDDRITNLRALCQGCHSSEHGG